jgi:hypothetical protein
MASVFNNINSTIGNQVNGTLIVDQGRDAGLAFIQMQLGLLLKHLQADTLGQGEVHPDAVAAVKVLQHELGSPMPERDRMDQALRVIDGVSSVAAMAGQIRALLSGWF